MSDQDNIKTISVDVDVHHVEPSKPAVTVQHKMSSSEEEAFAAGMVTSKAQKLQIKLIEQNLFISRLLGDYIIIMYFKRRRHKSGARSSNS